MGCSSASQLDSTLWRGDSEWELLKEQWRMIRGVLGYIYKVEFSTVWNIWPDTFFTQNRSIFLRCRTVIFPSKACNSTTRKSILAISVCNCPLFFQLRNHAYMQPRCPHLAVQIFNRTGQKFDLDFSVQIFVRLAWFRVNGTPYRNNFRILLRREEQHPMEE